VSGEITPINAKTQWDEDIGVLLKLSISQYNRAQQSSLKGDYEASWEHIQDSISIFPFIQEVLLFGFTLALELGEYAAAKRILTRLSKFLSQEEITNYSDMISSELEFYNAVIATQQSEIPKHLSPRLIFSRILELQGHTLSTVQLDPSARSWSRTIVWVLLSGLFVTLLMVVNAYSNSNESVKVLSTLNRELKEKKEAISKVMVVTDQHMDFTKKLNATFSAYINRDYTQCAELLIGDSALIPELVKSDSSILNIICGSLYRDRQYQLMSQIKYQSAFHIHADFYAILDAVGQTRRTLKVSFVNKYDKSNVYTPPLLRELFETEDMQQNRQRYATNLFSLITLFPEDDLAIYLSSEMKIELENQSEFPTTEQ